MTPTNAEFWFDIADETRPLSDIPQDIVDTVLTFLNQSTADEIAYAVPLLDGWTENPAHAQAIVQARGNGFDSVEQLWEVEGLGPARFTEVMRSIANTDPPQVVNLASSREQPAHEVFSSSETELKFQYEILMPGQLQGMQGKFPAPETEVQGFGSRN